MFHVAGATHLLLAQLLAPLLELTARAPAGPRARRNGAAGRLDIHLL